MRRMDILTLFNSTFAEDLIQQSNSWRFLLFPAGHETLDFLNYCDQSGANKARIVMGNPKRNTMLGILHSCFMDPRRSESATSNTICYRGDRVFIQGNSLHIKGNYSCVPINIRRIVDQLQICPLVNSKSFHDSIIHYPLASLKNLSLLRDFLSNGKGKQPTHTFAFTSYLNSELDTISDKSLVEGMAEKTADTIQFLLNAGLTVPDNIKQQIEDAFATQGQRQALTQIDHTCIISPIHDLLGLDVSHFAAAMSHSEKHASRASRNQGAMFKANRCSAPSSPDSLIIDAFDKLKEQCPLPTSNPSQKLSSASQPLITKSQYRWKKNNHKQRIWVQNMTNADAIKLKESLSQLFHLESSKQRQAPAKAGLFCIIITSENLVSSSIFHKQAPQLECGAAASW